MTMAIFASSANKTRVFAFLPITVRCESSNLPETYIEGFHDLEAVKSMEYRVLGKTGLRVSKLSLGSGPLGVHYGSYDETEAIEMVQEAIKKGINYIETGYWYGQGRSEKLLGKALKGIPRKAYYLATKVGRYELDYQHMFDFSIEKTRKNFHECLERLHLDYVDIIQVHDVEFAPSLQIVISQTLPELSKFVRDGKAKFVGITGYSLSILKNCIEKSNIEISCILTYCRNTLIDNSLLEFTPFFKEKNIGIINASAAGMGLLTSRGPPEWHPADDQVKSECAKAAQYCKERDVELAKLALFHACQCPETTTCLTGMNSLRDLRINLESVTKGIDEKEKKVLEEIKEKFLSKVMNKHWEGKEVAKYRQDMEKLSKTRF